MASFTINVEHSRDATAISREVKNRNDLVNLMKQIASGALTGDTLDLHVNSSNLVAASATLTLTSAIATDAITIGTVTMTATSTPTLATHWEIDGASDTLDAASLAAAINANTTLNKIVIATSATNVVTVKAQIKGVHGNFIPISSADATIVASGTFLTGGTGSGGTAQIIEA